MKAKMVFILIINFLLSSNFNCIGNTPAQIFSEIYERGLWGFNSYGEGWSGGGSSFETTETYRNFLQLFLELFKIESVVDLGCGDWEFSKHVNWGNIHYMGFDVVETVIQKNQQKYKKKNINFICADALNYDFPSADLLLCKDVLQHLTNRDILLISSQFKKYKYCLITNGVDFDTQSSTNPDIERGDYRPLDLTKPPFNLSCKKVLLYRAGGFMMQVILIENI